MQVRDINDRLLSGEENVQFEQSLQIQEEGLIKKIECYQKSLFLRILAYSLCVCSGGLFYLLMRWNLRLRLRFLYQRCTLRKAQYVLIHSFENEKELIRLRQKLAPLNGQNKMFLVFEYRLYTYFLDDDNIFKLIQTKFLTMKNQEILQEYCRGVQDVGTIVSIYGSNNTTIPDKSTLKILIDEILSPFYIFQIFSVILWCFEEYYPYAVVIFVTSAISIIVSLQKAKQNFQKLRQMTEIITQENVYRNDNDNDITIKDGKIVVGRLNNKIEINSKDIVPGDLIEVKNNWSVPCDCILINGSCIVNESMLTGESIPIIKTPIPYNDKIFNPQEDSKQCTLFAGTKCIEARNPQKTQVLAIACQIGFSTSKGQLVRSILFPKPTKFSFHRDSMKFIAVLGIMAVLGYLLAFKTQFENLQLGYLEKKQLIINALDLITLTVPPALPTCLQIGVSFALKRLQKKQIYCISPNRVNVAGKITIMCFDKTGTLTEDGLDLYGVRPIGFSQKKNKLCFQDLVVNVQSLQSELNQKVILPDCELSSNELLLEIMATCHGLARVQGSLIGDPLEVKMFESTNFQLDDIDNMVTNTQTNQTIQIVKRFDFSSTLQRMSVIVQRNGRLRAHVKGSPEKIRELCLKNSIPSKFHQILEFYSKMGYRVLACGSKTLKEEVSRDQVECNLTFLGFMVMENKLKPATKKIICQLQDACIRNIMVTGDNVLTAISVARQCNLVQPKQRIFLGDIDEDRFDGKNKIVWKDFEQNENVLHPENLSPEWDIQDNPDNEEEENKQTNEVLAASEHQTLEIYQENEEAVRNQFINQTKSKVISLKEKERQLQEENLDHLIDDQDPWKTDEPFVIAISGKAFQLLLNQIDINPKARRVFGIMLERASIFARMKPDQKACLITHLQKINRKALCGMCGDGANDCGALKAADVGISLSEAEASIAAPFTSKVQDISCIIKLLREGRASLVTSFQCFKYMALYSMIQFSTATFLYLTITSLSTWQFTFIDLVIIIPIAATMGLTKSFKELTQFQPGSNLISFPVLLSVIGCTFINISFLFGVNQLLKQQSWFIDAISAHKKIGDIDDHFAMFECFENTTLFLYANYQYLIQVLAFSIGKPFRRPFYTNTPFTVWLIFLVILITYIMFLYAYPEQIKEVLVIRDSYIFEDESFLMPKSWFLTLFMIVIANFFVIITFEKYAVPLLTRQYRFKKRQIVKRYRYPENPYLRN